MVVAVSRKRTRKPVQLYKDDVSSENSDFDKIEESDYESEEERPRKKKSLVRPQQRQTAPEGEENSLFKALSSPVVAVSELALEWIESYMADRENNKVDSFVDLFNLLLKAVGCKISAQSHDLISVDSAVATVTELSIHFEKQKVHENPFASPNKEVRHFRKNVIEFFGEIIFYAHEKGCLYKDEIEEDQSVLASDMMTFLILWLSALSASKVRAFRFVATLVILAVQTQLCHQAASLEVLLERQLRQLSNAQNTNLKRKSKSHEEKILIITKNLQSTQHRKDTIDEYLDEITRSVFVHRYRDLDSSIRVECLKALGDWMLANPGFFLLSSYLRYFGWLLSDPTDIVREEVVKVLHKLFKSLKGSIENMAFSFRKFTKRFQQQLINMIWKESVTMVKLNLFGIYQELLNIGYLQESDKIQICSYVIHLTEAELSSTSSSNKLRAESSRLVSSICESEIRLQTENSDPTRDLKTITSFTKLKILCDLLQKSFDQYSKIRPQLLPNVNAVSSWKVLKNLFCEMYTLEGWSASWESIVHFLFFDASDPDSSDVKHGDGQNLKLELSNRDQYYLLAFLTGCVQYSLSSKSQRGNTPSADEPSSFLPKLSCHLEGIEDLLGKSPKAYPIFMDILNQLLTNTSESLRSTFEHSDNIDRYNRLHGKVLQYFLETLDVSSELMQLYKEYFATLLKSSDQLTGLTEITSLLINPDIYLKVEDLILALLTELQESLSDSNSTFNAFQEASEQDDPFADDQKDLCNMLIEIANPLAKLTLIGDVVSIIRFVGEPLHDSNLTVLEQLSRLLLSKLSFQTLVKLWPRNLLKVMPQVNNAWKSLLDFGLVCLCWKLEDLMYSMNDGTAETINVDLFLEDVATIYMNLVDIFNSLNEMLFNFEETSYSEDLAKPLKVELADLFIGFGNKLVDYTVPIKVFYDQSRSVNSFRDYDAMFLDMNKLGSFVKKALPKSLQEALMNVFLIQEANLAELLDETLDRTENESVNFEEYFRTAEVIAEVPEEELVTKFDSSDDEIDDEAKNMRQEAEIEARLKAKVLMEKAIRDQEIWTQEKNLSIYLMKIYGLIKSRSLSTNSSLRFSLNKDKLGRTFQSVVSMIEGPMETTRPEPLQVATGEQVSSVGDEGVQNS